MLSVPQNITTGLSSSDSSHHIFINYHFPDNLRMATVEEQHRVLRLELLAAEKAHSKVRVVILLVL